MLLILILLEFILRLIKLLLRQGDSAAVILTFKIFLFVKKGVVKSEKPLFPKMMIIFFYLPIIHRLN